MTAEDRASGIRRAAVGPLLAAAAAVAVISAAWAPRVGAAPDQTTEIYGDWSVRCVRPDNGPPCEIVQAAVHDASKQRIMQIVIAHAGKQDAYTLLLVLPLGARLADGVRVNVDGATVASFPFSRCEAHGCLVESALQATALQALRRGKKGEITIVNVQGQPFVLPLSLKGVGAAADAMVARNRAWAGEAKGAPPAKQKK